MMGGEKVNREKAMERLITMRSDAKMSRNRLAQLSGVSESTIYKLEKDLERWDDISDRTVLLLSEVFGVSPQYFLGEGEGEKMSVNFNTTKEAQRGNKRVKGEETLEETKQVKIVNMISPQPTEIDVLKPVTARADLPRPEHVNETWKEQTACFLEGQRRAYFQFINLPNGTMDDLNRFMLEQAQVFVKMHDLPMGTGKSYIDGENSSNAILDEDTKVYLVNEGFFGTKVDFNDPEKLSDIVEEDSEIKTVTPMFIAGDDGTQYDLITIDGDEYVIKCPHDQSRKSKDQHQFTRKDS